MKYLSFIFKPIHFGKTGLLGFCLLVATVWFAGCKPKSSAPSSGASAHADHYFQTSFQNECEFIVQAIVSDLAEQIYYAANHQLPESISVTATEKPGSSLDAPTYELQVNLGAKQIKCDLVINGPIWSAPVYREVAMQIAKAAALKPATSSVRSDTALLAKLMDGTPETIERENARLSLALENEFSNAELHEQAALLYGAFLLRDHSGYFTEMRSPLSRLTAHLVMADFFRGSEPAGLNGRMADAIMLTLVGNESSALKQLDEINNQNADVLRMVRTLRARNTGDYRALGELEERSNIESAAWFLAKANYVASSLAWPDLTSEQKQTIDFVRIANETSYSVEIGHQLLTVSVPLEMQEIQSIYSLSHSAELTRENLLKALNELPEGCFTHSGGKLRVRVIGWGQWANFLQRHLCHAIQQDFYFMNSQWGVREEAKDFAIKCNETFNDLRLYPFVRRFNCTDVDDYHKAVDDGFKVTVATPQFVPARCWNYLCYRVRFAPPYNPNPNPHVNEWHNHNPPPGTVYDIYPRLDHPSLTGRSDATERFEQLHEMAPYDCRLIYYLVEHKYDNHPTYEQATNLFASVLPYGINAMRSVAETVQQQPELYEKLMIQAGSLNPICFYDLGDYELNRQQEDLAAKYIDQACAADPDSVRVSNHAYWRVQYYLKKGQTEKARQIADQGGEVYSSIGLEAKASFLEQTGRYNEAFSWYEKIEERYGHSGPLLCFCDRYKKATGSTRFDREVNNRLKKVFPTGMEKVSLANFQGAPKDGVVIKGQNDLVTAAGLRAGDVIVALNGTRTHTFAQYMYVRDVLSEAELPLIVWQGNAYREITANPPKHMFGVEFGDYQPR